MPDVLLRELSNADIDWLVTHGSRQRLQPAEVLLRPDQPSQSLYLLLEGKLAVFAPHASGTPSELVRSVDTAVAQLSRGELIGESWLFNLPPAALVTAVDDALVLAVDQQVLLDKLHQDVSFAAHFYRALALIMSERVRQMFERPERLRYGSGQTVKEALFVFGELRDSDIDWMLSSGQVERLAANKVLLQAGRPVDALHTVLDGQLMIAAAVQGCDPLSLCFQGLENQAAAQSLQPIAYISRGSLPGIISFLELQPTPVMIRAVRESLVFSIPRQKVVIKLQEDLGFSSRFYRVIAAQTASLLRTVVDLSGDDAVANQTNSAMSDELNMDELQQVSQGGTKFDWMLRRLGVCCG